jgi:hypothetical protein
VNRAGERLVLNDDVVLMARDLFFPFLIFLYTFGKTLRRGESFFFSSVFFVNVQHKQQRQRFSFG